MKGRVGGAGELVSAMVQHPRPVLDTRLVKTSEKMTTKSTAQTVFRSKLWWDHLPSQQVRARGKQRQGGAVNIDGGVAEEQDRPKCQLFGQDSEGSTWHVLALCEERSLTAARREAADKLREAWETEASQYPGSVTLREELGELFMMEGDQWQAPPGWEGEGAKAGLAANPWYGIFDPKCVDAWCGEGEVAVSVMDRVINSIRCISLTAVAGCYAVWREAGARWGEVRRDEDQKVRRRVLEARRAANRRAREEAALGRIVAREKHREKNVRTIQLHKAEAAV